MRPCDEKQYASLRYMNEKTFWTSPAKWYVFKQDGSFCSTKYMQSRSLVISKMFPDKRMPDNATCLRQPKITFMYVTAV